MIKNVSESILLLLLMAFMASCTALQPARDNSSTRKAPYTKAKTLKENTLRKRLPQTAKKYTGVKYKYAGKTPKGFDCSGFTSYVYDKHNIQISPSSKAQAKIGKKVAIRNAQAGDLAFFGTRGKVSHVALVVSNDRNGLVVIHSTSSKGVMVQNVSKSSYWKPRLLFTRDVLSP